MAHACGPYTVERFLAGKGPRGRALFDRFVELVARCGPFQFAPARTRVAVMVRVRFAYVHSLSERGMTVGFGLPEPLDSPRIRKVERYMATWYGHELRVATAAELDDEVGGWLERSYHQMGEQKRFRMTGAEGEVPGFL
jgi:hypothetical protein